MKLLIFSALAALSLALTHEELEALKTRHIPLEAETLKGQDLVDYVNAHQTTFKAKLGMRYAGVSDMEKKRMIGGVRGHIKHMAKQLEHHLVDHSKADVDIPASFDSRTQWANCPSIGYIRDQSACGACWAFGATEAMSDRICIASGAKTIVELSAGDLLACCGFQCGFGCGGGYPINAWRYWVSTGIVTGSNYEDHTGCSPYPFPECEHHIDGAHYKPCSSNEYSDPKCTKSCQAGYTKSYSEDKFYGKSAYGIANKVEEIQKEILMNGPVEAAFDVYEDFEHYAGGVYQHTAGPYLGGHAVRVLGWGEDNGIPYWLVANSWNTDWGENGYFRMIRGTNECGFEEAMVAGLPNL